MVSMIDVELDSIYYCLINNSNIPIFNREYYTKGDTLYMYDKLVEIYNSEKYVSLNIFRNEIKGDSILHKYLSVYNDKYVCSYTIEECERIMRRDYNRRVFIDMINDKSLLRAGDDRILEVMMEVISKFRGHKMEDIVSNFDKMVEYIINVDNNRYKIGIEGIDSSISIEPDRFIVIGGASGSGKTAFSVFLINKLCQLYSDSLYVLFISLEMSEIRVMMRLISLLSGKSIGELKAVKDKSFFEGYRDIISGYSLDIMYSTMDIPKLSAVLQGHINEAKRRNKIPVVFIDHFGEVSGLDEHTAKSNTDKITALCKDIARQGGICFGLTQLRKDLLDKRNEGSYYKPSNGYIMNSQSVEARADVIMHLWRPEYHDVLEIIEEEKDMIRVIATKGSVCIINDKNRDDKKGDIWLDCDIKTNSFKDMDSSKIQVINKF